MMTCANQKQKNYQTQYSSLSSLTRKRRPAPATDPPLSKAKLPDAAAPTISQSRQISIGERDTLIGEISPSQPKKSSIGEPSSKQPTEKSVMENKQDHSIMQMGSTQIPDLDLTNEGTFPSLNSDRMQTQYCKRIAGGETL